jgi:mannose-1-phosphate guanylyltransferase / mannose-6-phosphate isomerase
MSMTYQRVTPVILCGGAGTRLWPVSRERMPKHFVPLIGDLTTFQQVLERVSNSPLFAKPVVITNDDFRFVAAEQIRARGVEATIILEPVRRDSAAAIAAASEFILKADANAILLVVAADHLIPDAAAFAAACETAVGAAAGGAIVTFGVEPTYPATSYGYISPKEANGSAVRGVVAFVEKPNEEKATDYVKQGYLWNSGNFMFRADVMLRELNRFAPDIVAAAKEAVEHMAADLDFCRLSEKAFAKAPRKSIDYAVMEHTEHAAVLPVSFRWSDVGNWKSVWDVQDRDAAGNVIDGSAEIVNATNSLIRSEDGILTTVVGLDDIVVVATADAVLVAAKREAERVKELVEQLKARNRNEALEHRRIYRPWGYYQTADATGGRYQVKRICVHPGGRLSLQKHFHRSEHWVVVHGTAEVTVGEEMRLVHENESIYVPAGAVHRLSNPGKIPLELIEVQVGSYLGEDDIIRLDDVYHRQTPGAAVSR